MAGVITCPLDVVKTRIQTQLNPLEEALSSSMNAPKRAPQRHTIPVTGQNGVISSAHASSPRRYISTSSPSTSVAKPGSINLGTSSILTGLKVIYNNEGVAGLFRGVGPRLVWTSVQSGTMLVLYQALLRQMNAYSLGHGEVSDVA